MRLYFTSISSKHLKKAKESQRLKELMACSLQNITLFYKRDKQRYNAYEKENTNRNIVLFFNMKNKTEVKLKLQC